MNNQLYMAFFRNMLYDFHWQAPFMVLFGVALGMLAIWTLIWKGMALWKAAQNSNKGWFIALLLINTLGVLDILYIYVFSKKSKGRK